MHPHRRFGSGAVVWGSHPPSAARYTNGRFRETGHTLQTPLPARCRPSFTAWRMAVQRSSCRRLVAFCTLHDRPLRAWEPSLDAPCVSPSAILTPGGRGLSLRLNPPLSTSCGVARRAPHLPAPWPVPIPTRYRRGAGAIPTRRSLQNRGINHRIIRTARCGPRAGGNCHSRGGHAIVLQPQRGRADAHDGLEAIPTP